MFEAEHTVAQHRVMRLLMSSMEQTVNNRPLTTYLNDHLAGSVAALKLLDYLVETAVAPEARQFFATLHREVTEDQQMLEELLQRVGGTESQLRKAGAWLTEKLGEVKLRLDDVTKGELRQLEALEALALGIQGKLALWLALDAVSTQVAEVRSLDLVHLRRRAHDQYLRVESRRLLAARAALGAGPSDHATQPQLRSGD